MRALSFTGDDGEHAYSSKPHKPWLSVTVTRPIRYLIHKQHLLFVLLGTFFFNFSPSFYTPGYQSLPISSSDHESNWLQNPIIDALVTNRMPVHSGWKIPLGIKRKGLRILMMGGAGFVGSHLVDRLVARVHNVIMVDNFFTRRNENVMHHFGNPRFKLI